MLAFIDSIRPRLCSEKAFDDFFNRCEKRVFDLLRFFKAFKLGNSEVNGGMRIKSKPLRPAVSLKCRFSLV